jgi:hypothetical protein
VGDREVEVAAAAGWEETGRAQDLVDSSPERKPVLLYDLPAVQILLGQSIADTRRLSRLPITQFRSRSTQR